MASAASPIITCGRHDMAMLNWVVRLISRLGLTEAVKRCDEGAIQKLLLASHDASNIKQLANCYGTQHEWVIQLVRVRCAEIRDKEKQQFAEQQKLPPLERATRFPTFQNLADLKSGHDEFSRLKLAALRWRVMATEIENDLDDDSEKATAYRWLLRGLPPALAVEKVKVGKELARRTRLSKFRRLREAPIN